VEGPVDAGREYEIIAGGPPAVFVSIMQFRGEAFW
jgi:hypothetical protein